MIILSVQATFILCQFRPAENGVFRACGCQLAAHQVLYSTPAAPQEEAENQGND
jgi:hypothetical protein